MLAAHDTPNHRPVHPECPATRRLDVPCDCTSLWAGWDGTEPSLRARAAILELRESRRRDMYGAVAVDEDDLRGYWRESERLKAALVNIEKAP